METVFVLNFFNETLVQYRTLHAERLGVIVEMDVIIVMGSRRFVP